jgi:hypothetical protein
MCFVVKLKPVEELYHSSPVGIDSADTTQLKQDYRSSCPQPGCHQLNSPWPGIIK